ncbi:hypothetical protein HZH66_003178 [Vespula vulgaris]|uniref:Uncharacterized protein n=1 Tax=Vespula vulgaris TaxID=7454 RepID=A0A834KMT6_VESVU|nr:hypothetical protein HZH66_003178 [Vespula vulgaris]
MSMRKVHMVSRRASAHVPVDNENYWKEKESRIITNEHDITTVTRRKSTLTRHHASVRPCVRASSASAAADVADSAAAAAPAAAAAAAAAAATCAAAFRLAALFRSTAATMRAHLAPLVLLTRFFRIAYLRYPRRFVLSTFAK